MMIQKHIFLLFFFIARFSVRVAGAEARDQAATPHGLPSTPSFCLGEVLSGSIQDPQSNRSIQF